MKTTSIFVLLFAILLFADTPITIEDSGPGYVVVSIEIDSMKEKKIIEEGVAYDFLGIEGLSYIGTVGQPQLPARSLPLLTSRKPNVTYEVLSAEIEERKGYRLYPMQTPQTAVTGEEDTPVIFAKDEEVYSQNRLFPRDIVSSTGTLTYRGSSVSYVSVNPVQYNPVSKVLTIHRKLKVKISFDPALNGCNDAAGTVHNNIINNMVLNPVIAPRSSRSIEDELADDLLIVTIPAYNEAAEKLAEWQRMKGYDVKIESRESWTTASVKETTHAFYKNTNPKPSYLLFLGDIEHVPATEYGSDDLGTLTNGHDTDNDYACVDGDDDFVPEMATGRISADNSEEAMRIVNKIITYEKTPPTLSSFYNNALSCAYFQDHGEDGEGGQGYADRGFVQVVDRVNNYLKDDHNITSERIFSTRNITNPTNYNNTHYSWGEPIPDYLRRGTFKWIDSPMPWDSDKGYEFITAGINRGSFLVYHYDHGSADGWGHPTFRREHISSLNNGELLPVIYSIDCLVGSFNVNDCFAEKILSYDKGGTVGIVAASTLSWSGNNDALLQGMIDATWPSEKMTLASPAMGKNPEVTTHDPIYTLGDILLQGKLRMVETWHWESLPGANHYHFNIYHLFGDPTTEMWTAEPQKIEIGTLPSEVAVNATKYKISGMNIEDGYVTLYNKRTKEVIGKGAISGNSVTVPMIANGGKEGDTITVTVRSHNYIPQIKEIVMQGQTAILDDVTAMKKAFTLTDNAISLNRSFEKAGVVTLHNLQGRVITEYAIPVGITGKVIDFTTMEIANGMYVVSILIDQESFVQQITIEK